LANELIHADPGTSLSKAEYDAIVNHICNNQVRGDILISNSGATGWIRLAKGTLAQVLTMGANDPQWGGDISLGANKLKTTSLLFKEQDAGSFTLRNLADTAYVALVLGSIYPQGSINFGATAQSINAYDADGAYSIFAARDTGVGNIEIARLQGAADPEFKIGNNGNALRGSAAGLLGFFATAPQAKPIGVAVTAAGIHAALVTLGLIAA